MRPLAYLGLACLAACAERGDGPDNPCVVATSMNEDAFSSATSGAPACERDQDCTVVFANISCPNVDIGDCGRVVHRLAAERYAQARVEQDICEAVEGSQLGCSASPLCVRIGAPRCQSGVCVAESL